MTITAEILCLGEAMIEFVRQPGGRTYQQGFGGDTSNAAIAAARQGASTGYLTAVGQDQFGQDLIRLWTDEGIDTTGVYRSADHQTGIYFVDPDPVARSFTYYRAGSAASRMSSADLSSTSLSHAAILHVSGITLAVSHALRETALHAVNTVRSAGRTVSLDTNLRLQLWSNTDAQATLDQFSKLANIVFTSIDDQQTLTGHSDPVLIAARLHALGPQIVIVTMGGEGAFLSIAGDAHRVPAAPATPVDSTGAGDTFAGAFLAWWHETGDPVLAARLACIAAAATVSAHGAIQAIPERKATLETARKLGIDVPPA